MEDVIIKQGEDGTEVVEFWEGPSKTQNGGLTIKQRTTPQAMFSTDGRKSDPVQLFKLWLSKQPEGMKNTGPLYLSIINRPKAASSSSTQDSGMEEVIQSSEFVETETPCKCTLS